MVHKGITALYALTFLASVAASIMLITSYSTPNWVEVVAVRNVTNKPDKIVNPGEDRYTGYVTFGIMYGDKKFNYGTGIRDTVRFIVFQEYEEVYNTQMVVAVVAIMIPAILFAVVSTIFSAINTNTVPIETIHGRPGLYMWNLIGLISSAIAMIIYTVLFVTEIRYEALAPVDSKDGFYIQQVYLGYSFWLLVTSFVLFCFNLIFLLLTKVIQNPSLFKIKRRGRTADLDQSINKDITMY